ncbi:beta-defensin 104A-like [Trichosurus vulpecula]|uniref:beta-defensin 104A-like n=1 Tax=Trichosurus vulpecula TaxID=9337 RepID=UPI00186B34E1|nr:beta-defensin 104A-like [Trichosurus vulpecula]
MRSLFFVLAICLLLVQMLTVRSGIDDKICGYGTALCRRNCQTFELKIGKCPNSLPCCLKSFKIHNLNPSKVKN